jgi:hypothetical protein
MFMDVDASKEKEDGMARVVDHVRGLYVRARVDDARRCEARHDDGAWRWRCGFNFNHHNPEQQQQPDGRVLLKMIFGIG